MTVHDQVIRAYEDARQDVYHYLLRLGLSPAEAQEGAQEVFLRLYISLRKGDTIQNPRAWVFRVAHNLGRDAYVERGRSGPLEPGVSDALADSGADPEHRVIEKQRADRVERAVAELSPQQRQCLHLRAEGLRYREIAAAIGVGVSTVGEFLSRAMVRLRSALDE